MNSIISLPQKRLSKDAIKVWMLSETITNLIAFIILGVLLYLDYRFSWKEWIGWILIGITIISVLGAAWSLISPFLLYKNWRFDVDQEFLQLKSGVLNEVHELVPMTKIQSVATKQGPLLRKYRLCSVSIETMGSSHSIPALPKEVAIKLRNQIAQYAKIKEVEQ
ncbi:PH domain-containing protein [Peribacillus frigoritolerans]|nr:PH domain-containing protein [Peribacillus frigoritolerans]MDF1996278.1 PH domain-containing protein [Peribacillus frigoritolerans]